jgi:hypothetical protein
VKEKRKPYDTKYELKRKMKRTEAATVIQKQYNQKKNREEATTIAKGYIK